MRRSINLCVAVGIASLLFACATPVERANEKNDLLAVAGFRTVPVTTDEQRLELQTLPPNHVVQKTWKDRTICRYADPYVCGYLYVGDQSAWDSYRREQLQQNFLTKERMNAEMNGNAAWNWSMWGLGWWVY